MKLKIIIMCCIFVLISGLLVFNFLIKNNQQIKRLRDQSVLHEDIQSNSKSIDNSFIEIDKYVLPVKSSVGNWVLCSSTGYNDEKEYQIDLYSVAYADRYYITEKSEELLNLFCNKVISKHNEKIKVKSYKKKEYSLVLVYSDGDKVSLDLNTCRRQ